MRFLAVVLALTTACVSASDLFNLPGPFKLVTTQSTSLPVISTGEISLYYPKYVAGTSSGLNLFTQNAFPGTTFQLVWGVLGTTQRPDDMPGSLPYNATTPSARGLVTFKNQYAANAGFDILDGFLAIHGVVNNTWYLCPSNDGFDAQLLTYAASNVAGCTFTRVAVKQ